MLQAFTLQELDGSLAAVVFDLPGVKVNTLSCAVWRELWAVVERLERRTDLRGLLFRSGKPGQFIAGADLKEIEGLTGAPRHEIEAILDQGCGVLKMIERLPFPTVALIEGACLGGGTEVALAMDYRIAADTEKTRIGLPETKIGLIPGWGGTQRLPRIVGVERAAEMIVSGEPVNARRAVEIGLVSAAVPVEKMIDEAMKLMGEGWKKVRELKSGRVEDPGLHLDGSSIRALRPDVGASNAVRAALQAVEHGAVLPLAQGLLAEKYAALKVFGTEEAAEKIRAFFQRSAGKERK